MAGGTSALNLPLHADLLLLDESGRELLREAGPPKAPARRLQIRRAARKDDHGAHRAAKRKRGGGVQMDGKPGAAHRRPPKRGSSDLNMPPARRRAERRRHQRTRHGPFRTGEDRTGDGRLWFALRPRAAANGFFGRTWRRRRSERACSVRTRSRTNSAKWSLL